MSWQAWDFGSTNTTLIDGANIYTGTITGTSIKASTITGNLIAAGAITTSHLAFTPVSSSSIVATINATTEGVKITTSLLEIASSSDSTKIDGGKIYTGSVTADAIAAGAITADKLTVGAITRTSIVVNGHFGTYNTWGTVTSGWTVGGSFTFGSQLGTYTPTNGAALAVPRFRSTTGFTAGIIAEQTVSVQAGQPYTVVGLVYSAASVAPTPSISLRVMDSTGTVHISTASAVVTSGSAVPDFYGAGTLGRNDTTSDTLAAGLTTAWRMISYKITIPAEYSQVRLQLYCESYTGGGYIDVYPTGIQMYLDTTAESTANLAADLTAVAFAGDVTGAYNANTVVKIRNYAVASTAPTANQVLVWNGTTSAWTPTTNLTIGTLGGTSAAFSSTLAVTGASTFTGATTHSGGLASTSGAFSTTLSVAGASTFAGATTHNGGLTATTGAFSSTLGVTGAATFASDVITTGTSTSWGATPSQGFHTLMGTGSSATWLAFGTSGGTFRGGVQLLDAGGGMRLYYSAAGFVHLSSTPNVNGTALALCSGATFTGAVSGTSLALSTTLAVTGTSTFTGATTHNGGLGATSGTFSTTLAVTGASTFTGTTTHNGGLTATTGALSSTLTVTGATTLTGALAANGGLTATTGTLSSTLAVTGTSTFTGATSHNGGLSATSGTFSSTLAVTGNLAANGGITSTTATFTGTVTAPTFTGALSGNATTATTAGTVTTAAQPTITSVGTLTSLTVSGTLYGARTALRDDCIENFATASDSAGVGVNYYGYQGGNTYYRNFTVYNGKGSSIALFNGSTLVTTFYGAVTVNAGVSSTTGAFSSTLAVTGSSTFTGATTHNGGLTSTTGAFTSTLGVVGVITAASGVTLTGAGAAAGSVGSRSDTGLALWAKTGTTYDFGIANPVWSAWIIAVPTGTTNVVIPSGSLTVAGSSTFTGSTSHNGGLVSTSGDFSTTLVVDGASTLTGAVTTGSTLTVGGTLALKSGTSYAGTFTGAVTADRTWTMPDKSGIVAMTSDLAAATLIASNSTTAATYYPLLVDAQSTAASSVSSSYLTYNPNTGALGAKILSLSATMSVAGVSTFANSTASTSKTTGAVVISAGGLGVYGAVYASTLNLSGAATISGTLTTSYTVTASTEIARSFTLSGSNASALVIALGDTVTTTTTAASSTLTFSEVAGVAAGTYTLAALLQALVTKSHTHTLNGVTYVSSCSCY